MGSLLSSIVIAAMAVIPIRPMNQSAQPAAPRMPGETRTLLADGTWLVLGGEAGGRPTSAAAVEDAATGARTPLAAQLRHARAWHTATTLPDGRILVLGGEAPEGGLERTAELYEPARGVFEDVRVAIEPRARHTSTLLTDGTILVAGGRGQEGEVLSSAEIWDPRTNTSETVRGGLGLPTAGHSARLQADGTVLIQQDPASDASQSAEIYTPISREFVLIGTAPPDLDATYLAASVPEHGAVDVPPPSSIVLRFSRPLAAVGVGSGSVRLESDAGEIAARVTLAEAGRLMFVWPEIPLTGGSVYTLMLTGAVDDRGQPVPASLTFTTAGAEPPGSPEPQYGDDWIPGPNSRGTWRGGRPDSPWRQLPALQAPPGVTALSGQVLGLSGRPLAHVTVSTSGTETSTDRTGRFVLSNVAAGPGVLLVDGRTASAPGRTFGVFHVRTFVAAAQTNVLPYTIWLPRIDTAHAVTISSPTTRETVISTPYIPGLEVHLPKGAVIRDHEGRVATEVSIAPIPVDRTPFPLPTGVQVPVYFTIQPGGGFIETPGAGWPAGARVVYPNYTNAPAGTHVSFWNYDPDERGWYVYGTGAVGASGAQVAPDEGVVIYRFTGTMFSNGPNPPGSGPPTPSEPGGDPVDLSTGLFVLTKTDLHLPDVIPLTLTRTYRPNDTVSRPFGIGANHSYGMFLWSAQPYQEVDLILPHGGRIHYVRISPGTGYADAVFEHTGSPSEYDRSRISWNASDGWDLRLKDGTEYVFGAEAPVLQSMRDRYGNTVRFTWSATNLWGVGTGNLLKVTSPNGRYLEFTYDGSNRITDARDNLGRTVHYRYDASGRLWKVTDPAGGVTEYTYDGSHRMLTVKDARGIVYLTNAYDANGRVIGQTQADATTYGFAYTLDGAGRVVQTDVTDPRGHVERLTFNASGYPTSRVEALGTLEERTTTYTRRPDNLTERVTDALGRQTDYEYDARGNVTSITRLAGTPDAVTTAFTYDATFNQVTSVTDPLSHTTAFTYDTQGRLTAVTDPLTHQTTLTYNAAGQVVTATTPANETTAFTYTFGDLVAVTDPLGRVTTRFVDAAGRLRRLTDPLGRTSRFDYDALNQVMTTVDPLGGETAFSYDPNGNLLTLTDALSHTTTWTYDTMDRVATRTDPLNRQESFTYDANGNLATWTDRKNQVTVYTYDALDRLTFTGFGTTGTPPTYESTTARTYDSGDRLTQVVDSTGGTITRTYDLLDRLTSETTPEGAILYTYDVAGRRSTMTVAGQPAVTYAYDDADRLTGITQATANVGYTYDAASRRASLTLPNGIVMAYAYDAASQLTGITYTLGTTTLGDLTYTYDLAGNRTAVGGSWARTNLPAALASASYDAANQIVAFGGVSFTYDANGNLTSDGSRTYTWNARNQLTALAGPVSGAFLYDGFGRRRAKTVAGAGTSFLYDGVNPVQELAGGLPAANLLTGLGIDEYLTRTDAAGARAFLTDALGSALALADASGAVQTQYAFEPFGATTAAGATSSNGLQFTGRENDGTGLYFYRARYYSQGLQRFISEDPLEFAAGDVNLYAYVGNQPTMWRDPSGLVKLMLPPGHPCRWPPDDAPKSKSDDQPPPEPPLSWWLQCSPFVVPDLLPIPAIRPGGTGMPRIKGPFIDLKPHPFPIIGPQPHIQINIWFDGVPGIQIPIRIPLPGWPWW